MRLGKNLPHPDPLHAWRGRILILFSFETDSPIAEEFFWDGGEERGEIGSFEDDFLSVLVVAFGENLAIEIEFDIRSFEDFEFIFEFVYNISDPLFTGVAHPEVHELSVRRIRECFAFRERMDEEIPVIALGDVTDEVRTRDVGLDVDIGALASVVSDIGVDFFLDIILRYGHLWLEEEEGDELDIIDGECVPKLCREENRSILDLFEAYSLAPFLIRVDTGNGSVWEEFLEIILDFLYPETDSEEIGSMTLGTCVGGRCFESTVMTEEFSLRSRVDDQCEVTAIAEELVSAVLADKCPRRTAPVKKQEAFRSGFDYLPYFRDEFIREEGGSTSGIIEINDGEHIIRAQI